MFSLIALYSSCKILIQIGKSKGIVNEKRSTFIIHTYISNQQLLNTYTILKDVYLANNKNHMIFREHA